MKEIMKIAIFLPQPSYKGPDIRLIFAYQLKLPKTCKSLRGIHGLCSCKILAECCEIEGPPPFINYMDILSLWGADKLRRLRPTHVSKSTVQCKNRIMIVKLMQCFLFSPKKFFTIYRQTTEGSFDIKE